MLYMDMSKQVYSWVNLFYPLQQIFRAVVDVIVKVQYAVCRTMRYQDTCVGRNLGIIPALSVTDTVAHKHWHTIEL